MNNYICIHKKRLKCHMLVLYIIQPNIMFTIMTWHIFIIKLFFSLQNINFCSNVIEFVLGFIPNFDNTIAGMKNNNMDETPSSPKFYFQTCLLFKIFILENKYRLPLSKMAKIYIIKEKELFYINFRLDMWHIQWCKK